MFTASNVNDFLRSVQLFKGLTDKELRNLLKILQTKDLSSHEFIIEQEDGNYDCAFIIQKGLVRIYRVDKQGKETTIALRGSGEIIGEMAIINGELRSAYVETIQPTTLLILSRENFKKIISTYPKVAFNLLKILSDRIRENNVILESNVTKSLKVRTLETLTVLVNYFPNREIPVSQEELATIIGATRPRVTEALNDLKREGKIRLLNHKITLI